DLGQRPGRRRQWRGPRRASWRLGRQKATESAKKWPARQRSRSATAAEPESPRRRARVRLGKKEKATPIVVPFSWVEQEPPGSRKESCPEQDLLTSTILYFSSSFFGLQFVEDASDLVFLLQFGEAVIETVLRDQVGFGFSDGFVPYYFAIHAF